MFRGTPRLLPEDGAELFVPTESTGPWTVTLVVTGPTGTAYEAYLRLQLKANSAWPKAGGDAKLLGKSRESVSAVSTRLNIPPFTNSHRICGRVPGSSISKGRVPCGG